MTRDAAARLAQQQLPERVAVPLERLHLLEHGRARRRQDAADDDVADLAAGVTADDGDHPPRAHPATLVVEQLEQLRDRVPVARGREDAEPLVVEELRERRPLDAVRIPRVELAASITSRAGAISAASSSRATFAGSRFERKLTR